MVHHQALNLFVTVSLKKDFYFFSLFISFHFAITTYT